MIILDSYVDYYTGKECSECGGRTIDRNRGEIFCANCGTVLQENEIRTSEKTTFSKSDWKKKARTGTTLNLDESDLGMRTKVGYGKNYYKYDSAAKFYRLNKWNHRERSVTRANSKYFQDLKEISSVFEISKRTRERAATIIRKYRREVENVIKREAVVNAAIHLATREKGDTIPIKELSSSMRIEYTKITKSYRKMCKTLDIGYLEYKISDVILRYANSLDLEQEMYSKIHYHATELDGEQFTSGKSRGAIAASLVYVLSKIHSEKEINQEDVADAFDITPTTLRQRSREVFAELDVDYSWEEITDM